MTHERLSTPPHSVATPAAEWASLRTGAVRAYRDDALLDRVQNRLEHLDPQSLNRRGRRPVTRVFLQLAAAMVMFGVGVGVGRGFPEVTSPSAGREQSPRATAETRASTATTPRQRTPEKREARTRTSPERSERKRIDPAQLHGRGLVLPPPDPAVEAIVPALVEESPITVAPSARAAWLELADRGDYPGALAELERSQAVHLVLATGNVEELMTMAEVARFAGNQERAIQALSQVVDRYGRDPNAPLAAMMLGNLLSRSGDAAGAARAFALNRTLSPGGDFAEDALVREFDLALAAENVSLASNLFDQYAREFPAGPHFYAMRYELDELVAKVEEEATQEALPSSERAGERTDQEPGAASPSPEDDED